MAVTVKTLGNPKASNVGWVRRMYLIACKDVLVFDPLRYPERSYDTFHTLTTGDILAASGAELFVVNFPKRSCTFQQSIKWTEQGSVYEVSINSDLTKHAPDLLEWWMAHCEQETVVLLEDQNGTGYLIGNEEHGVGLGIQNQVAEINTSKMGLGGRFAYPMLYLSTLDSDVLFAEIGFEGNDYSTDYITN